MTYPATAIDIMPRKILIVENDEGLIDMLNDLFSQEGYLVSIHQNTDDIFALIDEFKPDIVLLDYLLSGINGGEMCSQIKKNKETSHIPVIIFSAFSQVLLSLGSYGCNAFIAKPFEVAELLQQVEKCISNPAILFSGIKTDKRTASI